MAQDFSKIAAVKDRKERNQRDLDLWKQWDHNGRKPEDMKPLLGAFRPMIRSQANKYINNVEIPPPAIQAEFTKQFANAVQTYNPEKGTLGTWVGLQLKKGQRWIGQRQNTVRIAENVASKITDLNNTNSFLETTLGRPPTDQEIAERMGVSVPTVGRIRTQQRKDLIGSTMGFDPTDNSYSTSKEILKMLPYDLTPQERTVFEHITGTNGKPKLSGNEIASKMNVSPSTVSRLRSSIMRKAEVYR